MKMTRIEKGFTLIEAVASLGVAAAVIVGALGMMSIATEQEKAMTLAQSAITMRSDIKKISTGFGKYLNTAGQTHMNKDLIDAQRLPNGVTNPSGVNLSHNYGGSLAVRAGGAGAYFYLEYAGVPVDACMALLTGPGQWPRVGVNTIPAGVNAPLSPTVVKTPASGEVAERACRSTTNVTIYLVSD